MTLDELSVGHSGVITAVGGEGILRCRLLDMGLIPRTAVKLMKVAPMGDPIEIRVRGYELTLRLDDAARIEITPAEAPAAAPSGTTWRSWSTRFPRACTAHRGSSAPRHCL